MTPVAGQRGSVTARLALLGLVLCAVLLALATPLQHYLAQQQAITAARAQAGAQRAAIDQLHHDLQLWSQPGYIEAQARERLRYTTPGTANYDVIGASRRSVALRSQGRASVPADPSTSWYARLWDSVVAAGAAPPRHP